MIDAVDATILPAVSACRKNNTPIYNYIYTQLTHANQGCKYHIITEMTGYIQYHQACGQGVSCREERIWRSVLGVCAL
jgi:hypothetical protein